METRFKKYIRYVLDNHMEVISKEYIDLIKNKSVCDIRSLSALETQTTDFYHQRIRDYLESMVNDKNFLSQPRNMMVQWKDAELIVSYNLCPLLPRDFSQCYTILNELLLSYLSAYTQDMNEARLIASYVDAIEALTEKIILSTYKKILVKQYYLN